MKQFLLLALLSSCLSVPALAGDPDTVVINEVFYLGSAGNDWVELKNVSGSTIDVSSYWLCARFSYAQLSSLTLLDGTDLNLSPGEIATVQVSFDLNDTSSDVGLYSSNSFSSQAAMVDFVQYGTSTDVGRVDVAVPLYWREISSGVYDFVATAAAGQSLSFDGVNNFGLGSQQSHSTDFDNGTQTRSAENFNIPVELQSFTVE